MNRDNTKSMKLAATQWHPWKGLEHAQQHGRHTRRWAGADERQRRARRRGEVECGTRWMGGDERIEANSRGQTEGKGIHHTDMKGMQTAPSTWRSGVSAPPRSWPDEPVEISPHPQVQREGGGGRTAPPWWDAAPAGVTAGSRRPPARISPCIPSTTTTPKLRLTGHRGFNPTA